MTIFQEIDNKFMKIDNVQVSERDVSERRGVMYELWWNIRSNRVLEWGVGNRGNLQIITINIIIKYYNKLLLHI